MIAFPVKERRWKPIPDDLNPYYLDQLLIAGIDRLSIGIQSLRPSSGMDKQIAQCHLRSLKPNPAS
ncbi:MAG: hypothetical protein IPI30_14210 [Saprospiraceae bacterium]|nr:hypothetical protein [Candidatus Vicinibacter affinis]